MFKEDPKTAPDSTSDDINQSFDSTNEENNHRRNSWLVDRFIDHYRINAERFNGNKKLKLLIEEFIDLMETEYFESALYDLIDQSYT
jgi:hypothetical protein